MYCSYVHISMCGNIRIHTEWASLKLLTCNNISNCMSSNISKGRLHGSKGIKEEGKQG